MKNCTTVFDWNIKFSESQKILVSVLFSATILLILTTNGVLILVMVKFKQLKTAQSYFIVLLSFSDLVLGAVTVPLSVLCVTNSIQRCFTYLTYETVSIINGRFSAYMTFLIALDRYIRINPNLTPTSRFCQWLKSNQGSIAMVILCLVTSFFRGLMITAKIERKMFISIFGIIEFLALLTMLALYIRIYCKVRSVVETSVVWNESIDGEKPGYFKHLSKTVFVIVSVLCICYLPFMVANIVMILSKRSEGVPSKVQFWWAIALNFTYLNSGLNAVIIIARQETLREFVVRKLLFLGFRRSVAITP